MKIELRMMPWAALATVLVVSSVCVAAEAPRPSAQPATKPATRPASLPAAAGELRDDWLSQIALDELAKAAEKGDFAALYGQARGAVMCRLAAGHVERLQAINDLWFVFRACRHLPTLWEMDGGPALVKMLMSRPDLARLLLRAVDDAPDPAKPLRNFHAVWKADPKAVEEYSNLAVAFAVAVPPRAKDPNQATIEEAFRFYTDKRNAFRYDVKAMPYEFSVFLADSRLPVDERMWARQKYANRADLTRTYFDLAYDMEFYRDGKPKKIESVAYTLPNLLQKGGVCIDQAYYAAEVCKAFGVPTTIDHGEGASGVGHAWLASLKLSKDGKSAAWDLETARYEAQRYYVGEVRSPIGGRPLPDYELALLGFAAQLPSRQREEADTAADLAELVTKHLDSAAETDRTPLQKFADAFNARFARGGVAPVQIDRHVPATRKLDASLAEDLLAQALERNLAQRAAWNLIVTMRTANQLPVEHLNRFFDVLVKQTAATYPDYSCDLVLRIVPTMPDAKQRLEVYQRMAGIYSRRPDLQGQILIAVGDEYLSQKNADMAIAAYKQAASLCVDLAAVVTKAAEKAERLYLEKNKRDEAIAMYEVLFAKTKRPRDSAFRSYTAWYKLGKHLASLYGDAGKQQQAAAITKMIEGK